MYMGKNNPSSAYIDPGLSYHFAAGDLEVEVESSLKMSMWG